jgi:hypothetical protein
MVHQRTSVALTIFLLTIFAFGSVREAKAVDNSNASPFNMHLQFEVFSTDLKTETVYTSNYELLLKAQDSNTPNFTAVICKPSFDEAVTFLSSNETGTNQIDDYLKISEQKQVEVNRWFFNPIRYLPPFGSPYDHFEISFLLAVNMSIRLDVNDTWFIMPLSMQGDWSFDEHPPVVKLAGMPDNQTLIGHGLNPDKFYRQNGNNMTDFYLITETFSFPYMQSLRTTIAYSIPPLSILLVAVLSVVRFKRMKRSDFLTLYLSAGLFAFAFLVSFYQYAPSKILTWQEVFLYVDFFFVTALAILAILFRKDEEPSHDNKEQRLTHATSRGLNVLEDKTDSGIQVLLSEISVRENSTLVISTVGASASLATLALLTQSGNINRMDLAWMALLFSIVSFLYREITIWSVERQDYIELKKHLTSRRGKLGSKQKGFIFVRMCFVRFLLLIPLATWFLVISPGQLFIPAILLICGVGFFSFFEYWLRYDF